MKKQIEATFHPPDREVAYCPFCGAPNIGRWISQTKVQVIQRCEHFQSNDRQVFAFWKLDPWRPCFPDPEAFP